jgi:hypothetical protein
VGMGTPSLVNGDASRQPGAEATGQAAHLAFVNVTPNATASRRQDVANEHQRERANLGFARFRPKESRAGCPELSVKPASLTASRRQEAANEHQRERANLGFARFRPKEKPTGCRRFP